MGESYADSYASSQIPERVLFTDFFGTLFKDDKTPRSIKMIKNLAGWNKWFKLQLNKVPEL